MSPSRRGARTAARHPALAEAATGIWNPDAYLRCTACRAELPVGPAFTGCPLCGGVLEVGYRERDAPARAGVFRWLRRHRLPLRPGASVDLGQGRTPLVAIGGGTFVKNETANPTWSHKDRAHGVNAAVARGLGRRGLVSTTTGNHGASASAFAAAAGLRSVVFCHPETPRALLEMIHLYGGVPAVFGDWPDDEVARLIDAGWYPATSMDPSLSARATPYGAEAYKAIAWEVVEQLGGAPAIMVVPSASGDTLYGIARGFDELRRYAGVAPPRIVAVQPRDADPLVRGWAEGRDDVDMGEPRSLALSIADGRSGRHARGALARWRGAAVAVTEEQIAGAVRELAAKGLLVEPASAAALPGLAAAREARLAPGEGTAVVLATAAGAKWLERIAPSPPIVRSRAELRAQLGVG